MNEAYGSFNKSQEDGSDSESAFNTEGSSNGSLNNLTGE